MQYLLDTNMSVFFLRGKLDLDEIIKEKGRENCYISEITIFELRFGAQNSDDPAKSHKAVDDFVNGLSIIPIFGCAKRYAKEKVRLRKIGKPMNDEFDLLIGVTAVENKLTLVTDKHYRLFTDRRYKNRKLVQAKITPQPIKLFVDETLINALASQIPKVLQTVPAFY